MFIIFCYCLHLFVFLLCILGGNHQFVFCISNLIVISRFLKFSFEVFSFIIQHIWVSDFILTYSLTTLPFHIPRRSKSVFCRLQVRSYFFVSLILFSLEMSFLRQYSSFGISCYALNPLMLQYVYQSPTFTFILLCLFILDR